MSVQDFEASNTPKPPTPRYTLLLLLPSGMCLRIDSDFEEVPDEVRTMLHASRLILVDNKLSKEADGLAAQVYASLIPSALERDGVVGLLGDAGILPVELPKIIMPGNANGRVN